MSEAEIEKLWIDDAIRCDEELDNGTVHAYPADDVLAGGLAGNGQSLLDVGENVADAYANLEVLVVSWKIRRMPS